MMHLETKAIGEVLLDVLADYGAAYAGCGGTEQSGIADRWETPVKERIVLADGRKALDQRLFRKV